MSMIALRLSLKLLIFKSLVLNMVLILKLWLIAIEPLLLILIFLKEIGTYIMNLLKTLASKMKLLLMIAIHMLKLLKVLFLISMLIFVEKLPFKPLPPKEGKKKKRSKKREKTVSSPKHVAPIIVVADESELDDEPMPITYSSDHDH